VEGIREPQHRGTAGRAGELSLNRFGAGCSLGFPPPAGDFPWGRYPVSPVSPQATRQPTAPTTASRPAPSLTHARKACPAAPFYLVRSSHLAEEDMLGGVRCKNPRALRAGGSPRESCSDVVPCSRREERVRRDTFGSPGRAPRAQHLPRADRPTCPPGSAPRAPVSTRRPALRVGLGQAPRALV
jgi:hypothetical protein